MAKIIEPDLAEFKFTSQGVRLNSLNGLETLKPQDDLVSSDFCTGKSVYELINLAKHASGWIKKGNWKILQIDNSSHFYPDQELVISTLLLGPTQQLNLTKHRTFLFEFGAGEIEDFQTEIVLAYLMNLMLIYEAHCYFISSGGGSGEMVSVQDGVIFFYGDADRLDQARKLLIELDADPMKPASWTSIV